VVQEIDYKKQLTSIINDPDSLKRSDIPLLKELVNQYPYFQPLRLILARLSMETEEAEQTLTTTALYTNGAVLHQFLQRKVSPTSVSNDYGVEDISFKDQHSSEAAIAQAIAVEHEFSFDNSESGQPEEIECVQEVNDAEVHSDEQETFEEIAEIDHTGFLNVEAEPDEEITEIDHTEFLNTEVEPDEKTIEDQETFEEISEVDAHDYVHQPEDKPAAIPVIETLEDNFVENIAATDFFAFEKNFSSEDQDEKTHLIQPLVENIPDEDMEEQETALSTSVLQQKFQAGNSPLEKDTNEVTNYDDHTLPYTFLWWLAKTRKEHSSTFQPYATPKKQNPNELHQQYVEHIFHIQSPFNAEEILNTDVQPHADPKDAKIIDEFIQKDPQISAPRPEQIDNENKAKKSAEDHNDLVSETLAKIYIEQMLYHKAIDTYEKLSLKFPEKSRYFADLIQSIKKKI
jgi:hypothetical protein